MIAALYARYSSDNQRAESIVAQLRASREYCRQRGYTIIKEYADEAMTGTNDQRPQYQQMLVDAEAGMFEVIVFHKVDRSARNEFDYYTNKHRLACAGVRVEYSGQSFADTPEGQFSEALIVGMSAYYSRNLSREVKKGQKENALAGKITGGHPPFGFDVDSEKRYIINEKEAPAVQMIFQMYVEGHGYVEIINWLNSHGYRTRRGQPFGKNSLHDMLNNRRYIGTCILGKNAMRPNGTRNCHRPDHEGMTIAENACPAIVPRELWDNAQEKLRANCRRGGRFTARHVYLLSGLVFCGECGHTMVGSSGHAHGGKDHYYYYRCTTNQMKGKGHCLNRGIPSDWLDKTVLDRLCSILLRKDSLEAIADRMADYTAKQADDTISARQQLQEAERKASMALERLYNAIEEGNADDFDLARLKKVKAQINQYRADLAALPQENQEQRMSKSSFISFLKRKYIPMLRSDKASDASTILHTLVEKIVATRTAITVYYAISTSKGATPSAPK